MPILPVYCQLSRVLYNYQSPTHTRASHHVLVHHRHGIRVKCAHATHPSGETASSGTLVSPLLAKPRDTCIRLGSKIPRQRPCASGLGLLDFNLIELSE